MSDTMAPAQTAFSFLEVLQQADRERDELSEYLKRDGTFSSPIAAAQWDVTERVIEIAHGTWVPKRIDAPLAAFIESHVTATPLFARRNPFAGTTTIVTRGVIDGLRDQVQQQRRQRGSETQGEYFTVNSDIFVSMVREGLVEWTLRANNENYEIRRCAQCGTWFEPQLKARSRFCKASCRKAFNNLRLTDNPDVTTFRCPFCEQNRPMLFFSGLRDNAVGEGDTVTLEMCRYVPGPLNVVECCIDCVRERFPEWRRYVAPMESLGERAAL